jgi:hypothetical protein
MNALLNGVEAIVRVPVAIKEAENVACKEASSEERDYCSGQVTKGRRNDNEDCDIVIGSFISL